VITRTKTRKEVGAQRPIETLGGNKMVKLGGERNPNGITGEGVKEGQRIGINQWSKTGKCCLKNPSGCVKLGPKKDK